MRRHAWLFALLLLAFPTTSSAIQLHWSSGADTLTFASATRCFLVVQADSAEATLPGQWRLLWLADSAGVNVVAIDSLAACDADTANISAVDPPSSPADSAAHEVTAHFCSEGEGSATAAYFVLDQPGGSRGRLKVVALDPTDPDSVRVIESNEVTYNGGVDGTFTPTILRAASTHDTRELRVTVVGSGLASASSLRVTAPDRVWSVPLGIVGRTDSTLTAAADVPVPLPGAVVEAETSGDLVSLAPFPADQIALEPTTLPDTILYRDPDPNVYPKDFAFYYTTVPTSDPSHPWKGLFHLIYIRHFRTTGAEPSLAHAWSENLTNWRVQTDAFLPNAGWDAQFVWAPSILPVGNLQYMYYTGVDASGNQRIGYATTALLDTTNTVWQRQSTWVYAANNTGWADPDGHLFPGQQQFRDPWVMPDPDSSGRFLLFNVGEDKNYVPLGYNVVGVARNRPGTLAEWRDLGSYGATDYVHTDSIARVESPLVARDSSGTGTWRIYFTNGGYQDPLGHDSAIFATQAPGHVVADTTSDYWPELDSLYIYLGSNESVAAWAAMEHLQIGNAHLFAAYNGDGIGITRAYWDGNNFVIGYPDLTAVDGGAGPDALRFFVADLRPGAQSVRFVLDSPARVSPRVVLYDIVGRRVRTLVEGREFQGRLEILWDCRDGQGMSLPTGMYFVRLTGAGAARVLRVPVVR
jgi:hypothetical protein